MPAVYSNRVLLKDGLPIAAVEGGELRRLAASELADGELRTLLARGALRRTPLLHPRAITAKESKALGNRVVH